MTAKHLTEADEATEMLLNRLRKNQRSIGKWARQLGHDCFRLYDADIPEFAFAIDLYGSSDGLQVHLQEYQAPKSIPEEKVALRRNQAIAAVEKCLQLPSDAVILKTRQRQRGKDQYTVQQRSNHYFVVSEGKAKFWVNLRDYLDTGLFLDHRPMRNFLFQQAKGKRVLNLFCYTASASVQAALGGAESTTSIDLSNTYLDWARRNFSLNGIGGKQHRLQQKDCMAYLENAASPYKKSDGGQFDLIFLDPPTFSNSKKTPNVLDIQRDHSKLIHQAMALLSRDGLLLFSTNKRKFRLDADLSQRFQCYDYSRNSIDRDFQRNSHIHQVWKISHC